MTLEVELDESQKAVAYLPSSARAIVIAGAGQGKTELVAARLQFLVEVEGLNPYDEILVLSFSRAAVQSIRQRMEGSGSASEVSIRTLDSFATHLLFEADREPAGKTFDQRIRDAVTLLESGVDSELIERLRHVIVDEIQDVVGDRSMLICAILAKLQRKIAGFTVLGDPLQAIYDFQLDSSLSGSGSEVLLEILEKKLDAVPFRLSGSYRAKSEDALAAVELGEVMRETDDSAERFALAKSFLNRRGTLGDAEKMSRVLKRWEGSTVILCHTNGQALLVSSALSANGVVHRVRKSASEPSIPAWVALAFAESPTEKLSKQAAITLIEDTPEAPDAEEAWHLLKATEGNMRVSDFLDLHALARRLNAGDIPVALVDDGSARIVVSTIHRAKGLEFDNVVILDERDEITDPLEKRSRASVIFVALTRARSRINTFTLSEKGLGKWKRPPFGERWQLTHLPRRLPVAFEMFVSDMSRDAPRIHPEGASLQEMREAAEGVVQGSIATGSLEAAGKPTGIPFYRIEQDGRQIGRIAQSFGEAIRARIGGNAPYPDRLEGIILDGVETCSSTSTDKVGRSPFWLGVRASGLVRLEFPIRTAQGDTK